MGVVLQRILGLAKAKDIKDVDIYRELGISKGTFGNWKSRNSEPSIEYIVPFCKLLGVSEHFLLTGEEDTAQPSKVAPAAFQSHIDPELLDLISQMNEREQIKLCERAQEILDRRQSDRGDSEAAV